MRSLQFVFLVAMICAASAFAADISVQNPPAGRVTFKVKVADLASPNNSLAVGMSPDQTVQVTLPGELFPKPAVVQLVAKTAVRRYSPEVASASDFSAFKALDPAWIAANFTHPEAPGIKANFTDMMIAEKTKALFDRYLEKKLVGRAIYQDKVILFVNYHDYPIHLHPEVYVKEANQWKRTNVLASDDTFDIISSALKRGDVVPENAPGK
jgi:hypothetical protein